MASMANTSGGMPSINFNIIVVQLHLISVH